MKVGKNFHFSGPNSYSPICRDAFLEMFQEIWFQYTVSHPNIILILSRELQIFSTLVSNLEMDGPESNAEQRSEYI